MIQRIQTLYIAAIALLQVLALQFSYLTFEKLGKLYELNSNGIIGLNNKIQFVKADFALMLMGIIAVILVVTIIFLFKNRRLQIILLNVYSFIAVLQIAYVFIQLYNLIKTDYIKMLPGASFYLIFTSMYLSYLAVRAVNKDENLIKSVDRIR